MRTFSIYLNEMAFSYDYCWIRNFALTDDPVSSYICASGSVIPDLLEGSPRKNFAKWRKRHRKSTHWYVPYLSLILFVLMINFVKGPRLMWLKWGIFFLIGSLFHIAQDSLYGKVPGIRLKDKVGIKIFDVGSLDEYVYVFIISVLLLIIIYIRGFF